MLLAILSTTSWSSVLRCILLDRFIIKCFFLGFLVNSAINKFFLESKCTFFQGMYNT
jgi:hypothetical protein